MDLCHLRNSELDPQYQKYKGRVVLRGDVVKDDSRSYAVFTEKGSSASRMTAAKVMDIISRLPGCAGQAADAVSAYAQAKMEDAPTLLKFPKSECPDIWIRPPKHKWPKSWSSIEDPAVPLERNLFGHPLTGLLWERQFEKVLWEHGWEKVSNCECFSLTEKKNYSYLCMWTISNWLERNKNINPTWKFFMKDVDLGEPTSFLVHVYLGCTQRECQISKDFWLQKNYQNQKPQENLMPNLCWEWNWPDSQSSRPRAEMRMPCAFRTGEHGKNVWTGKSRERRQQKMGETWEGWRRDGEQRHSCDKHFFHELQPCVYVTRMKMCGCDCARAMCRKMCVQQVRVCTHPVVHTIVATTCVRTWKNSVKKILLKKNHHSTAISTKKYIHFVVWVRNPLKMLRLHHSTSVLIFLVTCSISWLFINHCEWRLLGFPRHASLRDRPS